MIHDIKIEICCGGIEDVLTAIQFPIDRIELNSALELGGLTPTLSSLKQAKANTSIPILCMIRPRGDGFCYTQKEYEGMKEDAICLLNNNADGIVFGFLNSDKTINEQRVEEFVEIAHQHHALAIFHKAFDNTLNLEQSIQTLIRLKVDRILTSGGNYSSAIEGINSLKQLFTAYGNQIEILPGGGIRADNVMELIQQTGIRQIHSSASTIVVDPSSNENGYKCVSSQKLEELLKQL